MKIFRWSSPLARAALGSLLALTLAFTAPTLSGPSASKTHHAAIPAALDTLVKAAEKAIQAKDFDALKSLSASDAAQQFAWVNQVTTPKWEAGILAVPLATDAAADAAQGGAKTYLAVFHAWHTCESDGDHVHRLTETADGWKLGPEIPETETGGFRVRDHNLRVTLDVPQKSAQIQDAVMLERTAETSPDFILLRLSEDFTVANITLKGTALAFQQVGGLLTFRPPDTKKFEIAMTYAGHVNHQGSDYIRDNEATLNSYWYPHIARLPSTATVTATAPVGWTPIAQGELKAETTDKGGAITRTYRNDIPTCFFTLDMGKYHVTTRTTGGRTLLAYLLDDKPALAQSSLDTLESAIRFFDTTFARFPYSRYTVVQTQGAFQGALEAYSFATFGPGTLPETIVHELSHTWWGGLVPCAYTRSMWNESFAEYSDGLYHRQVLKEVRTLSPRMRVLMAKDFTAFTMRDAHDTSDDRQAGVGYGKGPLVLQMLENEIGLETMKKCCAAFAAGHPKGEAAEWEEFEGVVNKITGKNYRWFFAQWEERTGLPVAHLENVMMQHSGANYIVEGDFVQEGEPVYRMHVPVRIETADRPVNVAFEAAEARTHFRLTSQKPPTHLYLDPQGVVPLGVSAGNAHPLDFEFK